MDVSLLEYLDYLPAAHQVKCWHSARPSAEQNCNTESPRFKGTEISGETRARRLNPAGSKGSLNEGSRSKEIAGNMLFGSAADAPPRFPGISDASLRFTRVNPRSIQPSICCFDCTQPTLSSGSSWPSLPRVSSGSRNPTAPRKPGGPMPPESSIDKSAIGDRAIKRV